MSKRFYGDKLKRAVHLLFFRRGKMPGARDWELKTKLGKDYEKILQQLNELLRDLDLEVKKVEEVPTSPVSKTAVSSDEEAETRYVVALKGTLTLREARMSGWRIDNLAGLTIAIAHVISKQGKALREDLEKTLAYKFGRWRSMSMMDIFIRTGYLSEDEKGMVSLGWRTKAEVDLKSLMTLLLGSET